MMKNKQIIFDVFIRLNDLPNINLEMKDNELYFYSGYFVLCTFAKSKLLLKLYKIINE